MPKEKYSRPTNQIYPKVYTCINYEDKSRVSILLKTSIRKKRGKYWYWWDINKNYKSENENDLPLIINEFHSEVYHTLIIGNINTKFIIDGVPLFPLCDNQEPEVDRLRNPLLHMRKFKPNP